MMPDGWVEVRLGDLAAFEHGWPFKSGSYCEPTDNLPIVVGIGNFRYEGGFRFDETRLNAYAGDFPRQYVLAPNDVLMVMTCQTAGGEILGIPGRIPDDGRTYLHNQRMAKVVVRRRNIVEPDFLYWVFRSADFNRELVVSATGTKILHTAPSRIGAYQFALPPPDEQRAIARLLGALDDKIELNRRMNETLEAIARALFKSWFVAFDPVRAKAEGRQPWGMDAETAALFPSEFEESELGEIPKGWRVGSIGQIANISRDSTDPSNLPPNTLYIGLEHMPRGSIALDDWETAEKVTSGKLVFRQGDVLFGKLRPYFKKVGVAPLNGVCSSDILVIGPKKHRFGQVLLQLADQEFIDYTEAVSGGTRMPRVSWADVARYSVAVPPEPVGAAFDAHVEPLTERMRVGIFESRTLAGLRDTLLPKLLSGELRVREAVCETT